MDVLFIKHIEIEGPGTLTEFLETNDIKYKIVNLYDGETLPSYPESYRAIIILGGPMNVYEVDKYPFLRAEDLFIKDALKKEVHMLGLCLGAQLIAKAAGARVRKAVEKEIGWYKINLTPEGIRDPLFYSLNKEFYAFQWHGDTFDIPRNSILLATSATSINQAFKYNKNVYGLQFHLEVTRDMISEWLEAYSDEINSLRDKISKEDIMEQALTLSNSYKKQASIFYSNFFKIANY